MATYKRILLSLLTAAVVFIGLWFAAEWALVRWLRTLRCGELCALDVESLRLRPGAIALRGVHFSSGDPAGGHWSVHIPSVRLEPYWTLLARGEPAFRAAELDGAEVTLAEGSAPRGPRRPQAPPGFMVTHVEIRGARFTYVKTRGRRLGTLRINDINLNAGPLGGSPGTVAATTHARVSARLEGDGRIGIELSAKFFQRDPELRLLLSLEGQDLARTNDYFLPIEGIALKGQLRSARTAVSSDGRTLHAEAEVHYQGLSVDVHATDRRSGFAAFVTDLFAGLVLKKGNAGEERTEARGEVLLTREPNESIVTFVLRGLKEAAMKVAKP